MTPVNRSVLLTFNAARDLQRVLRTHWFVRIAVQPKLYIMGLAFMR